MRSRVIIFGVLFFLFDNAFSQVVDTAEVNKSLRDSAGSIYRDSNAIETYRKGNNIKIDSSRDYRKIDAILISYKKDSLLFTADEKSYNSLKQEIHIRNLKPDFSLYKDVKEYLREDYIGGIAGDIDRCKHLVASFFSQGRVIEHFAVGKNAEPERAINLLRLLKKSPKVKSKIMSIFTSIKQCVRKPPNWE